MRPGAVSGLDLRTVMGMGCGTSIDVPPSPPESARAVDRNNPKTATPTIPLRNHGIDGFMTTNLQLTVETASGRFLGSMSSFYPVGVTVLGHARVSKRPLRRPSLFGVEGLAFCNTRLRLVKRTFRSPKAVVAVSRRIYRSRPRIIDERRIER